MLPFNVFVCFPCYVINEELGKANNKPVQIGVYYRIYIPYIGDEANSKYDIQMIP